MVDPYTPLLDSIAFTEADQAAIEAALLTADPWGWKPGGAQSDAITSVKTKIRDLHMARHGDRCCYCRKNLHGGGHFIVDREHVLPKSRAAYKLLAYEIWNLGISCKRCNMQYKRSRIDFVVDKVTPATFRTSANYRLIHPNFDLYKQHIGISTQQDDDVTLVKYTTKGTEKGDYTYDYFNLKELEVGSCDAAQGALSFEGLGEGALEARFLVAVHQQ